MDCERSERVPGKFQREGTGLKGAGIKGVRAAFSLQKNYNV